MEMIEHDQDYFEGKTSPINYNSILYKITAWLRCRTIINLLKELDKAAGVLIDIGCAFGDLVSNLSRKGYVVFGCDISKCATLEAKKLHPEANIIRADAHFLPLRNKAFNIVTMLETLEHCLNPNKALGEIHRIIAKDGVAIISIPTTDLNNTYADKTHIWHLPLNEWQKHFEEKFSLLRIKYFLRSFRYISKIASNTFIALKPN
jgi:2-polyprenyl-3-methyl-5-hydroxy-6-metoxy-1,4-benzoquinol methylase